MEENVETKHLLKDYSNRSLQKMSFLREDLSYASFSNSDLRGTDFSGATLAGADFSNAKTGIRPKNTVVIFLAALLVSALSGYVATLAGNTVQIMLSSQDGKVRSAGIITIVTVAVFIGFSYWKGTRKAVRSLVTPVIVAAAIIGSIAYFSGLGTGRGMLYEILALILVVVMFIVGTIARATAGALSNFLFILVALTGGMFGKSVGGGIGTVVMAVSCAMISKKALSGAPGFEGLQKIAFHVTRKYGTSFRNCHMPNADFSRSKTIRNADFSGADIAFVHWGNSKKINCMAQPGEPIEKA